VCVVLLQGTDRGVAPLSQGQVQPDLDLARSCLFLCVRRLSGFFPTYS
jgi:hypothetical protein